MPNGTRDLLALSLAADERRKNINFRRIASLPPGYGDLGRLVRPGNGTYGGIRRSNRFQYIPDRLRYVRSAGICRTTTGHVTWLAWRFTLPFCRGCRHPTVFNRDDNCMDPVKTSESSAATVTRCRCVFGTQIFIVNRLYGKRPCTNCRSDEMKSFQHKVRTASRTNIVRN